MVLQNGKHKAKISSLVAQPEWLHMMHDKHRFGVPWQAALSR